MFTLDTESGFRDVVLLNGAWGVAETVVQGRVSPDEFWVHKPALAAGFARAVTIEEHYSARSGHPMPMDIEWARDGRTGDLFILQARPETVRSQAVTAVLHLYTRKGKGRVLVQGKSVGATVAVGPVRVVSNPDDLGSVLAGDVLVAPMTDPDWEPC